MSLSFGCKADQVVRIWAETKQARQEQTGGWKPPSRPGLYSSRVNLSFHKNSMKDIKGFEDAVEDWCIVDLGAGKGKPQNTKPLLVSHLFLWCTCAVTTSWVT